MKVLLFTHEQDIDGMGSIIIAKQIFKEFDYVTCKSGEINQKVEETINNGMIYEYDFIFVTDLCIREPLLSQIDADDKLKNKILILDHHKTELENNKYSFVNVVVQNELGLASGTSLFYDYMKERGFLKPSPSLSDLAELTRQYDTWEWKTKYNNPKARMLHILFEQLGYKRYIEEINKIVTDNNQSFEFSEGHLKLINDFDRELADTLNRILADMMPYTLEIDNRNYKIGYVQTLYQYRNELAEEVRKNNIHDIDLIAMIITDMPSISYRSIKDVDVSIVSTYFGGNAGHKEASASPKDNEKFIEVFSLLNVKKGA